MNSTSLEQPGRDLIAQNLFEANEVEPVKPRRKEPSSGLRAPSSLGKNFVLDTNVLIHDPYCIDRFADNHVCIPMDVLSELDRFKNEQTDRGLSARVVHRRLTEAFEDHPDWITKGVPTSGGGSLRLVAFDPGYNGARQRLERFRRLLPDAERADHRILACALLVSDANPAPTVLVTKDLNMQLKGRALGIRCEDYRNDKVNPADLNSTGVREIEVDANDLQRFASVGAIELGEGADGLSVNEYVLFRAGDKRTMPARFLGKEFVRLNLPDALRNPHGVRLKPMNLGQQFFLDALLDPAISLVTCFGAAGTGKTLVAVAAGLHCVYDRSFQGLTVSRPVVPMGDGIGFLPGDLDEKMRPWLQPIYDAFDYLMPPNGGGDRRGKNKESAGPSPVVKKAYEPLIEGGVVEVEALCYIRGRSIPNRFFILDEAQQISPLEAKTVVTRMSKGSKLVMIGDPAQIDNPYVDSRSNGLVYTRRRLKGQRIAAHISLTKGERSALAEAGAQLM